MDMLNSTDWDENKHVFYRKSDFFDMVDQCYSTVISFLSNLECAEQTPTGYQAVEFVTDICTACSEFMDNVSVNQYNRGSIVWAIATASIIKKNFNEKQAGVLTPKLYIVGVAPNCVQLVFGLTKIDGGHFEFSTGLEISLNQNLEKLSKDQIPIDLAGTWQVPLEKSRFPLVTGIVVLPRGPGGHDDDFEASIAISTALRAILYSEPCVAMGVAIHTTNRTVYFGEKCSLAPWQDLCSFHFWPFSRKCKSLIATKRDFMTAVSYHVGGGTQLASVLRDPKWWPHLPFSKTVCLYHIRERKRMKISMPLGLSQNTFEINTNFTVPVPHPVYQNIDAFMALLCSRAYSECRQWLLHIAYQKKETRQKACQLHPLLSENFIWTELCIPPGETKEDVKQVLFERYLLSMAKRGEEKYKQILHAL